MKIQFRVISQYDVSRFQAQVQAALDDGWELYGSTTTTPAGVSKTSYTQAIIRHVVPVGKPVEDAAIIFPKAEESWGKIPPTQDKEQAKKPTPIADAQKKKAENSK